MPEYHVSGGSILSEETLGGIVESSSDESVTPETLTATSPFLTRPYCS